MSIIKKRKMREMSENELSDQLKELRLELSKELAASEIGTAKNPGRIGSIRKTIARILTLMNIKKHAKIKKVSK